MSTKHQRSVNFTAVQLKWLEARAKELGITVSDVIRRMVDGERERKYG